MWENFNLKDLTFGVILGYIISWGIFFVTLPLAIKLLGKVTGTAVNYGISWVTWIVASAVIKYFAMKKDDAAAQE